MRRWLRESSWSLSAVCSVAVCVSVARSQTAGTNQVIDLPTALRLAGAQALDVKIARERVLEAQAMHRTAVAQFFPWISPGFGFRRHEGRIQEVTGNVIDADKQSYTVGGGLGAQWDVGEAIYKTLSAKQQARAASHALESQRQDSTLAAAHGYFDLALAQGAVQVAEESVRIAQTYSLQVGRAVEAGIAFKGDELRAQVQTERNKMTHRQALEQQRLTAARLAHALHLDPSVALVTAENELAPLSLSDTNATLHSMLGEAFANRPELKESRSLVGAARNSRDGAVHGPWIPSLGAQAFVGGLGGGRRHSLGQFGPSEDYAVTLGWRIGPGGLFDSSRKRAADARLEMSRLNAVKIADDVARQVVEAFTRVCSLADQIITAREALTAATKGFSLARQRQEFAVGIVLETIQAEQDLTRSRLDYLKAVAEFNKAQYALGKAAGKL